ncbi:MAG: methyltransferase domain-containing protein [Paracoccus sp. (in: a-proteobacteria)]|uniref:methyltransferase domain-containing protein n=1 Tax=Paracoccus sp. TaxID=267 RepID=UPI0026E04271|nr:methyltransferase domain-containing protein [Paracoccus sp. (in: a-proteobacteria)]MDO5630811.1 methyltransferase domain-containing protein [Paracoccus sp. (in: a-proteobacteria)]
MRTPSPNDRPTLADRDALMTRRVRALRRGPDDFLHRIAVDEVQDRLAEVNRRFTSEAVVTGLPDLWRGYRPQARVVADDPVLDLQPGAHDLVIHAMALHWADDPVGQIIQCARALRPDGLFMAVLPGGETLAELRAALAEAEAAETGGLSPRVLPMAEIRDLGGLLGRAGLALPVADQLHLPASYRSIADLARDLRGMGESNAMVARLRRPTRRGVFARADATLHERFPDPDDPARFRTAYDLIFLTGWSPDDSQQKPLRPGSAQMRLADALNLDRTKP